MIKHEEPKTITIGEAVREANSEAIVVKHSDPISPAELTTLHEMTKEALIGLIEKVYMAGWGYGNLTGKQLLEMALKTKSEAYEALKLTALTLATNASDWREFHALASFWSDREQGKAMQAIDVTVKHDALDQMSDARLLKLETELARLNGIDALLIEPLPLPLSQQ